jgi:hypothetical protein
MLDNQYAGFQKQFLNPPFLCSEIASYDKILDKMLINAVKYIMPYIANFDISVLDNMSDFLQELVQKLSLASPISCCELILGLNKCKDLIKKIQEQLLGQSIQFIVDNPKNADHVTAFTLCCL